MRSFLCVTAHTNVLDTKTGVEKLQSFLLSCQRFSGSHTGTRIAAAFDNILETYNLINKVEYILTDNASNMKSAFKVNFPAEDDVAEDGNEAVAVMQPQVLDDESIWETLDSETMRSKIYLTITAKRDYPALLILYNWLLVMVLRKQNLWQKV